MTRPTRLSLTTFVTLDGVLQAPGAPDEDTTGGFPHGGWSVPYGDEEFGGYMAEVFAGAGAFLLGRRTYDIFAAYWPAFTDPAHPIAAPLNSLPKYVASTTLTDPGWAGTTVIGRDDLAADVRALKEGDTDGELQVHGSGRLARSLLAADLVDTLRLLVFPVVLGTGLRLFPEGSRPTAFRHTGARTTPGGIAINTYAWDGRPRYGSYA
ncbi:dihydrofolate reductase family protein [Streptomyces yaizuensis]|uniref:Dihydrofolate reductase family protein n=1 Tax=Streptomyces yaizuensis TaxID=2989713 RepID=A0ABQ5P5Y0_9ACTN|nr:dihydrofolate reductase family protein [Streptomyces sp. YSPA8]GLF97975.1 dihydrofolate reductase family protein [Streptomyces sp. YSPA8]